MKVYVCDTCYSEDVEQQYTFFVDVNSPDFSKPKNVTADDYYWCHECNSETKITVIDLVNQEKRKG